MTDETIVVTEPVVEVIEVQANEQIEVIEVSDPSASKFLKGDPGEDGEDGANWYDEEQYEIALTGISNTMEIVHGLNRIVNVVFIDNEGNTHELMITHNKDSEGEYNSFTVRTTVPVIGTLYYL